VVWCRLVLICVYGSIAKSVCCCCCCYSMRCDPIRCMPGSRIFSCATPEGMARRIADLVARLVSVRFVCRTAMKLIGWVPGFARARNASSNTLLLCSTSLRDGLFRFVPFRNTDLAFLLGCRVVWCRVVSTGGRKRIERDGMTWHVMA